EAPEPAGRRREKPPACYASTHEPTTSHGDTGRNSMDMNLSPAVEAFRAEVRSWVKENLPRDIHDKVDRGIELTRDDNVRWMRILCEKGWVATNWDKEDGGPGFTTEEKYVFEEEIFLAGAPRIIHYGTRMVAPVLLAFGTEEQKRRYLPKILSSEEIWCQGY